MNGSSMRYKSVEHALSIADVYFTLLPQKWLYEPKEHFEVDGEEHCWFPDFITSHNNGKIYAGETQLTGMSEKRWKSKWNAWNLFFKDPKLYGKAKYQEWFKNPPIKPMFVVITKQEKAAEGFSIPQRELKVIPSIADL